MTTTHSSSILSRAPRVSIAQRAAGGFAKHAFVHGYSLYAGRHVVVAVSSPSAVDAVVRTSRARRVRLRADGNTLAIGCACGPTSLEGPIGCKHAWAALLEVDRLECLPILRSSTTPLIVTRLPPEPEEGADAAAEDTPPATKPAPEAKRRAKKKEAERQAPAPIRSAAKPRAPAKPAKKARLRGSRRT